MLTQFLKDNRTEILALAEKKTVKLAGLLSSSTELRRGLPLFYDHLIGFLADPGEEAFKKEITASATDHGKELLRLHYTLSHVVHAYGAMCQAITECAQKQKIAIEATQFNDLNLCLDIAIAAGVSEFQFHSIHERDEREVQHMGFLVHELRNALSSATIAQEMIKQGLVGTGGSTARVLEDNLSRMRNLIDRSLSDVRMRAAPEVCIEAFPLSALVDQILLTAQSEARTKKQQLQNEIDSGIQLETDRQLLLSAIANLIQNALKYTKTEGLVIVRAKDTPENVLIEIQDECGGLDPNLIEGLFKPFVSSGFDQSGLGLGLTIVRRAAALLQGRLSIQNQPGHGCVFLLDIPKKITPAKKRQPVTGGKDSVQPSTDKMP